MPEFSTVSPAYKFLRILNLKVIIHNYVEGSSNGTMTGGSPAITQVSPIG